MSSSTSLICLSSVSRFVSLPWPTQRVQQQSGRFYKVENATALQIPIGHRKAQLYHSASSPRYLVEGHPSCLHSLEVPLARLLRKSALGSLAACGRLVPPSNSQGKRRTRHSSCLCFAISLLTIHVHRGTLCSGHLHPSAFVANNVHVPCTHGHWSL